MNGFELIAARMVLATSLTLSKTRVANYLAAHRQEALFASAQDPGAATGMSDATAIRKVRKLEFAGLDEMLRFLCRAMQDEPFGRADRGRECQYFGRAIRSERRDAESAARPSHPYRFLLLGWMW